MREIYFFDVIKNLLALTAWRTTNFITAFKVFILGQFFRKKYVRQVLFIIFKDVIKTKVEYKTEKKYLLCANYTDNRRQRTTCCQGILPAEVSGVGRGQGGVPAVGIPDSSVNL